MLSSDLVRSVLDCAPDAMLLIDTTGAIRFANLRFAELFGHEPATVIGEPVERLLPERFRAQHIAHRSGYTAHMRVRPMGSGLDLFALRKDGTEFPVEVSLSPIHEGENTWVVAAIRDITDRHRSQIELQEARTLAERANQAKSRFLATASHDLRQPLQALALLNGTMQRLVDDGDIGDALGQSEQAIGAMSRLLNALLDISKLESGAIQPELTDFKVATLFEELRGEFAGLAANKGLRFVVDACTDRVCSDPALLGQLMRNLVSNAIKYTREGSVQLRCAPESPFIRLEVRDTGIGIPADELTRIYDDFYQVGVAANTSRDGYGLGLAIVSRIVSLLGLKLEVRSEAGGGSTFSLSVPASHGANDTPMQGFASTGLAARPRAAGTHILLVEDDPSVRNATRMLLKVEGFEVSTAASLSEAIQQASNHRDIALLVTDYHLAGGETGIQVISRVRSALRPGLKAVLMTGDTSAAISEFTNDQDLRMASKPIDADELLALMRELLAT